MRPVLVNARCPATTEHTRRSGGGVAFSGYATFETAVERIVADHSLARALGGAGRAYVVDNFAWPVVTARYRSWLERVAETAQSEPAGSEESTAHSTTLDHP
jgi:glycosyltransferase involved in cell wall biosynthesis